jgi:hypothetical protein
MGHAQTPPTPVIATSSARVAMTAVEPSREIHDE